ncbi:MAG: phospholipid carrier-dependent glycosyltransferase [Candidatus Omnitrophica bacterium]|nr:phospholipid carrier-dependent glycosyltransferase [Candidatus Omnitrophota bacterium]
MNLPDALAALVLWAFLLPGLFVAGRLCLGTNKEEDSFVWGAVGTALGFVLLAHASIFLGLFHQFNPRTVGTILGVLFLVGLRDIREFRNWVVSGSRLFAGGRGAHGFLGGLFSLGLLAAIALCFLPEIANDALCYQLNVAKNFALRHSLLPDPYDFNSYTSTLMNSLYAVGLLFKSVSAAKLFHAAAGVLLVAVFMRRIEIETQNRFAARLAGLVLFLTPTFFFEITTTYVDMAVSLFLFLSFDRFLAGARSDKSRDWVLSGIFLGAAVSTKILILIAVVPYGVLFLLRWIKLPLKRRVASEAVLFSGGLLAASGALFIQSFILTQNPVFPYFGKFFGTAEFGMLGQFLAMGPVKSLPGFLMIPWNVTFRPGDYDGGYPLGPAFLMVLPFAIYGAVKKEQYRPHLIFTGSFLPVWYLLFHNVRFLFPALCLYAWAGAVGFDLFLKKRSSGIRKMLILPVLLLLIPLLVISGYHYRAQWPVVFGQKSRDAFLRDMERSYPLALWMEKNLPSDAVIFNAEEIRQFYFPRKSTREIWFYLQTRYDQLGSSAEVLRRLKEAGFTHLLLYRSREAGLQEEPRYQFLRGIAQNPELARSEGVIPSENIREEVCSFEVFRLL